MKYLNNKDLWENNNKNKKLKKKYKPLNFKFIINKFKEIIIKYKNNKYIKKNKKIIIKTLILIVISIWIINGFYIIKKREIGILTRLGKFKKIINSGIHWKITPIDKILIFNIKKNKKIKIIKTELTSDNNIIITKIITKYKITDPKKYIYTIKNVNEYIKKTIESILLNTISNYNIEKILFTQTNTIKNIISKKIKKRIKNDNIGINIKNIIFKYIQPPNKVKKLYNKIIIIKKNNKIHIKKTIYFANKLKKQTHYKIINMINKAKIYKKSIINKTKKDMLKFDAILSIYKLSPKIEKKKIYIEIMEKILRKIPKIVSQNKNIFMLSIKQNTKNKKQNTKNKKQNTKNKKQNTNNKNKKLKKKYKPLNNLINQRINNTFRISNRNIGNR